MFWRFLWALVGVLAFVLPSPAQALKPTVVATAKPISRLLGEYREMIRQVGGPAEGDRLVNAFDEKLKARLGENGFEGLDINRPFAFYSVVKEKFEDTNPVLILPVNSEKEFLNFLKQMRVEATAVKDKKGLYLVRVRGLDFLPNDTFAQFVDGWVYVGLNGDDVSDPKNRLPVDNLFDNADQSLATIRLYPGNFPEKLLKDWLTTVEGYAANAAMFFARAGNPQTIKMFQTFFDEGPKLLRRYAETGLKEAEEVRLQFSWEPNTGETFTELNLIAKPGTALAKEIAAKPAINSRFAGWKHSNAVLSMNGKLPLFAKEIQEIVSAAIGAMASELKMHQLPEPFHPFADELAKTAIQNVKKGDLDLAFALVGPDKNGKFGLVAAMSMTDTSSVEKALKELARGEHAKEFQFDVEKVAGIGIHKVPLARALNEEFLGELKKMIGDTPPAYVAFAKDAAFVSFGAEALPSIKTALEARPGPAAALEFTGNTQRFHKLLSLMANEREAADFAKLFGSDDKEISLLKVTVEGGKSLKARATLNLRYLPRTQFLD